MATTRGPRGLHAVMNDTCSAAVCVWGGGGINGDEGRRQGVGGLVRGGVGVVVVVRTPTAAPPLRLPPLCPPAPHHPSPRLCHPSAAPLPAPPPLVTRPAPLARPSARCSGAPPCPPCPFWRRARRPPACPRCPTRSPARQSTPAGGGECCDGVFSGGGSSGEASGGPTATGERRIGSDRIGGG